MIPMVFDIGTRNPTKEERDRHIYSLKVLEAWRTRDQSQRALKGIGTRAKGGQQRYISIYYV